MTADADTPQVVTTYPSRVTLGCCDPAPAHQIRAGQRGWKLYVSCVCRRVAGEVYEPLEVRELFRDDEMLIVYHAHLTAMTA